MNSYLFFKLHASGQDAGRARMLVALLPRDRAIFARVV